MKERFSAKKSLGQHFLNSQVVPTWLCEAGEVTTGDIVLEIGPGTGALTRELLKRGAQVIALEADSRAIAVLEEEFSSSLQSGALRLYHTDVRQFDPRSFGLNDHAFKVIANIPYYLTGQLFRTFLAGATQPFCLVFLVQKEVAKRAAADQRNGEKESLLSLSIKIFGEAEYIKSVGKGHFSPPPKVDSAIIAVKNINRERFRGIDSDDFFRILHLGFGSKRKQLLGNLAKEYDRDQLINLFSTIGIALDVRAEDLALETWIKLVTGLNSLNIHS